MASKKKKKVSRDTSDEEQVRSEQEMFELRGAVEKELLREVLDTFAGRHVIFNILARCEMYGDCVEPEQYLRDRFMGKRSVGLETLADMLTVSSSVYILMQKENSSFEEKYTFNPEEKDEQDG